MRNLQIPNNKINRVKDIRINLIDILQLFILSLLNPLPNHILDILPLHPQSLMILLIIRLLIVRTHLLLLNLPLDILLLQLVNNLLLFKSLLMFCYLLWFYNVIDQLSLYEEYLQNCLVQDRVYLCLKHLERGLLWHCYFWNFWNLVT